MHQKVKPNVGESTKLASSHPANAVASPFVCGDRDIVWVVLRTLQKKVYLMVDTVAGGM